MCVFVLFEKASFIPHSWVTDTYVTEHVQPPCHARVLKNTRKQVMSFAPRLNSMTSPVKSAQQFGSQTDQVWRQIKPDWAIKLQAGRAASVSACVGRPYQGSANTWQKASFIPHAWVTNFYRASVATLPCHAQKHKNKYMTLVSMCAFLLVCCLHVLCITEYYWINQKGGDPIQVSEHNNILTL